MEPNETPLSRVSVDAEVNLTMAEPQLDDDQQATEGENSLTNPSSDKGTVAIAEPEALDTPQEISCPVTILETVGTVTENAFEATIPVPETTATVLEATAPISEVNATVVDTVDTGKEKIGVDVEMADESTNPVSEDPALAVSSNQAAVKSIQLLSAAEVYCSDRMNVDTDLPSSVPGNAENDDNEGGSAPGPTPIRPLPQMVEPRVITKLRESPWGLSPEQAVRLSKPDWLQAHKAILDTCGYFVCLDGYAPDPRMAFHPIERRSSCRFPIKFPTAGHLLSRIRKEGTGIIQGIAPPVHPDHRAAFESGSLLSETPGLPEVEGLTREQVFNLGSPFVALALVLQGEAKIPPQVLGFELPIKLVPAFSQPLRKPEMLQQQASNQAAKRNGIQPAQKTQPTSKAVKMKITQENTPPANQKALPQMSKAARKAAAREAAKAAMAADAADRSVRDTAGLPPPTQGQDNSPNLRSQARALRTARALREQKVDAAISRLEKEESRRKAAGEPAALSRILPGATFIDSVKIKAEDVLSDLDKQQQLRVSLKAVNQRQRELKQKRLLHELSQTPEERDLRQLDIAYEKLKRRQLSHDLQQLEINAKKRQLDRKREIILGPSIGVKREREDDDQVKLDHQHGVPDGNDMGQAKRPRLGIAEPEPETPYQQTAAQEFSRGSSVAVCGPATSQERFVGLQPQYYALHHHHPEPMYYHPAHSPQAWRFAPSYSQGHYVPVYAPAGMSNQGQYAFRASTRPHGFQQSMQTVQHLEPVEHVQAAQDFQHVPPTQAVQHVLPAQSVQHVHVQSPQAAQQPVQPAGPLQPVPPLQYALPSRPARHVQQHFHSAEHIEPARHIELAQPAQHIEHYAVPAYHEFSQSGGPPAPFHQHVGDNVQQDGEDLVQKGGDDILQQQIDDILQQQVDDVQQHVDDIVQQQHIGSGMDGRGPAGH